ncbi:MAG: YgiT-type zinc finger protein, partial [Deltaproteobacteria bacterium]|nr:YgiT-type zinc finger protein [Deltaproteobacteria bacterium]
MKCHICGGDMSKTVTDLPFKLDKDTIVIVKGVPVQEC